MSKIFHFVGKLALILVAIPACAYALGFTQACTRFIGHPMGPTDWAVLGVERQEVRESDSMLNALRWMGFLCYVEHFADKGWSYNLAIISEREKRDSFNAYLQAETAKLESEDRALNENLAKAIRQPARKSGQFGGWSHLKKADDWLKQ